MGADLTALKIMTENRMNELDNELHKRISEGTLRSSLEAT